MPRVGALPNRDRVRRGLLELKRSPWLACVREPAALLKLPDDELKPWIAFWSHVESMLAHIRTPAKKAQPEKP